MLFQNEWKLYCPGREGGGKEEIDGRNDRPPVKRWAAAGGEGRTIIHRKRENGGWEMGTENDEGVRPKQIWGETRNGRSSRRH